MSTKRTVLILSLIILISSTTVRALVWDPDTDPDLRFNLNFEINTLNPPTTTDAVLGLIGMLVNFNPAGLVWQPGIRGLFSADFGNGNDILPFGALNDCRVSVAPAGQNILNFGDATVRRTWAFWFKDVDVDDLGVPLPILVESTFLRHQNTVDNTRFWDMYIKNTKLGFRNNSVGAEMQFETVNNMNTLGVMPNQWHHVVFVIDRTTQDSSKIYVDGISVPIAFNAFPANPNASGNVNNPANNCPLSVGANGTIALPWSLEGEFDGMLDEVRLYSRVLTPLEISILYQNNPLVVQPYAQSPIPRTVGVSMATGLSWYPIPTATAQTVKFGTDPTLVNGIITIGPLAGAASSVVNAQLGGTLNVSTTYYWQVNSTVGGNPNTGPIWSFTIETGKAANPDPYDGEQDVDNSGTTDLSWTTSLPSGRTFDVYFGDDPDALLRIENDITDITIDPDVDTSVGKTYYWRVNTLYTDFTPDINVQGDLWSFRTEPFEIVFNTGNGAVGYRAQVIPALTCMVNVGGWMTIAIGAVALDGVAIFGFPAGFNYGQVFDIIVLPEYDTTFDALPHRPLGINVTGNFFFDGRMDISGDDADPLNRNDSPKARCGGHRGPRKEPTPGNPTPEIALGYYQNPAPVEYEDRFGGQQNQSYYPPTTINGVNPANPSGYDVFGLGSPLSAPYKVGGGGGYGGIGGDSGRGYYHGIFAGGAFYGDKEVPVPFGGSAGSWGQMAPGSAGGGGVEIIATGNVELGSNCQILAHGGINPYVVQYPGGGGAGGSVKIIAGGNVINNGVIDVNGGDGGCGNEEGWNTGGGGGGGRVVIFYGGSCTQGTITANGGAKGIIIDSGTNPENTGRGLSEAGQDGTIYIVDNDVVSVRKASDPTPRNGDYLVYAPAPATPLTLRWYSGYNGTPANDIVYCDTSVPPTTQIGNPVPATRGQQSSTVAMNINPDMTYYMMVKTSIVAGGTVNSDVWSFTTVSWQCQGPDWPGGGPLNPNAGWPAWDQNHDCVVTDLDFWYFAKDWQVNRGGEQYILDEPALIMFIDEWMTCRARSNNGCLGWPLTP